MAWTPQYKVIDQRLLGENVLNYFSANQTDALAWASGDGSLDDFERFYTNASGRLATQFPCLMILAQSIETDLESEGLEADLDLLLEGAVSGSDPDILVSDAKKYAMAVESMSANIPTGELTAGTNQYHKGYITELQSIHDVVTPITSGFLQVFRVRLKYRLTTSGV